MKSDYNISPHSEDSLPNKISPEGAEVANTYLKNACSIVQTSKELNMEPHEVSQQLSTPMVKNYVQSVLKENGYRNMEIIARKLDDIIDKKWEELEEAEIGSNKDIADLLALAHKMRMDFVNHLQKDQVKNPVSQTNTQINNYGEGSYGVLMKKLVEG